MLQSNSGAANCPAADAARPAALLRLQVGFQVLNPWTAAVLQHISAPKPCFTAWPAWAIKDPSEGQGPGRPSDDIMADWRRGGARSVSPRDVYNNYIFF
jgi:hypothetical protein